MAAETESKWEGKVSAVLANPTAQQVWVLLEASGHCGSATVDGIPGQPGLIRYCAATVRSSSGGRINWAKEKLLAIDPIKRCLSYEVIENNTGIKSYVATMIVLPIKDEGGRGCKIEWSFVSDPIEGWRIEDLVSYLESNLRAMAQKMLYHYALISRS
ncbi:lachrymatory-factor synthase-like [Corylus avellana]|uniref:lachrymatory-factor synthase-like n=1 Tax=Corylus avellana TaxID=13451 RepID=UPI00286ABE5C|nr:lachrymatory-factor synthase-like [Corylus avellana]